MEEQVKTYSRSLLLSNSYHIYQVEFLNNGGVLEDFHSYTIQALSKKLRQKFGDRSATLMNPRSGLMFHDPKLSIEEAVARLKLNDEQTKRKDQIRAAASYLKSQILDMPKSLTPQPANMAYLKEKLQK